jgi:hypothetical protein
MLRRKRLGAQHRAAETRDTANDESAARTLDVPDTEFTQVSLPSIESIKAVGDSHGFLAPGVPVELLWTRRMTLGRPRKLTMRRSSFPPVSTRERYRATNLGRAITIHLTHELGEAWWRATSAR